MSKSILFTLICCALVLNAVPACAEDTGKYHNATTVVRALNGGVTFNEADRIRDFAQAVNQCQEIT